MRDRAERDWQVDAAAGSVGRPGAGRWVPLAPARTSPGPARAGRPALQRPIGVRRRRRRTGRDQSARRRLPSRRRRSRDEFVAGAARGARPPAARAGRAGWLAHRTAGGARPHETRSRRRRRGQHAVGRVAAARAARQGAGRRTGPAAPRRADQPPRYRGDHLARGVSFRVPGGRRVRHPRSRVSPAARDTHRRDRSRRGDVVARRLRDVPSQERGIAGRRGDSAGEVRQTAGRRRGLAATRRQGAADAGRGSRAGADGDARGAGGAAGTGRDGSSPGRTR